MSDFDVNLLRPNLTEDFACASDSPQAASTLEGVNVAEWQAEPSEKAILGHAVTISSASSPTKLMFRMKGELSSGSPLMHAFGYRACKPLASIAFSSDTCWCV